MDTHDEMRLYAQVEEECFSGIPGLKRLSVRFDILDAIKETSTDIPKAPPVDPAEYSLSARQRWDHARGWAYINANKLLWVPFVALAAVIFSLGP